jgi:acyl-coenzyme A synthetase/AMP-(fatty) acid ligase
MNSSNDSIVPSSNRFVDAAAEFSPTPLLEAFENFHGSFFDLERNVRISASALKKLRTELHRQMLSCGLTAGSRFLAAVPNGPLFAAVWAASLEAGASPILVHSDTPQPELDRMAGQWGAQFLVAGSETGHGNAAGTGDALIASEHGALRWLKIRGESAGHDPIRLTSVPLHPTSGTSAGPKLAVRPGPCAVAEPLHYIETLGIDHSDAILCAIPMSHAYAYGICFLVALLTSADLLFMRCFNPVLVHQALAQMQISVFPAVPIMLDSLLATDTAHPIIRPRIVLSAGAPLTRKTFEAFRHHYGLSARPLYGTTETGGIAIGLAENEFDGSVGPAMNGVEVDLRPPSGDDSSSDARTICVRSSSMMAGYLEKGGISRSALADGWFETGDLARMDAQARIYLQGRLSEVINVFGLKVVPREVEEVIARLPEVVEVKVYARRDMGPDIVEAAVVCRGTPDEERIRKHCEQHLVSYKCPTAIRFVDALPRTASGKVAVDRLTG